MTTNVGVLPNVNPNVPTYGVGSFAPQGVWCEGLNANTQAGSQTSLQLEKNLYFFTSTGSAATDAVLFTLPTGNLFDFDIRYTAKDFGGSPVHGAGRTLATYINVGGTVTVVNAVALLSPTSPLALTFGTPGSGQLQILVTGIAGHNHDWTIEVSCIAN